MDCTFSISLILIVPFLFYNFFVCYIIIIYNLNYLYYLLYYYNSEYLVNVLSEQCYF